MEDDKMDTSTTETKKPQKKGDDLPKPDAVSSDQIKRAKAKQDFTASVDEKIPKARSMALEEGKLHQALELLLTLEKNTRAGEDELSTIRVACAAVQLCFDAKDLQALKDTLVHISKRRGQTKDVVQKMVAETIGFVDQIQDETQKLDLIDTLRVITEGKMYVEIERARLTRTLCKIKEDAGQISEAAELLQEVQVETYGSMDPREKIDFILEQMRLILAKKDYIRAQIISRKVTPKALEKPDIQDLKERYYKLMVEFYQHDSDYLNICRSYLAIYNSPNVQDAPSRWQEILKRVVLYIVLSPRGTEQSDLLHRIYQDKKLLELTPYHTLVKFFINRTLISWPEIEKAYKDELNKLDVFHEKQDGQVQGITLWKDLRARVVEHNIGVVAEYYERIRTAKLATLLNLDEKETEQFISKLVSSASIWAKIDRPKGIVTFTKPKEPNEILNNWSHDVGDLLNVLEKTCHMIHREMMVHGAATGSSN